MSERKKKNERQIETMNKKQTSACQHNTSFTKKKRETARQMIETRDKRQKNGVKELEKEQREERQKEKEKELDVQVKLCKG